MKLNRNRKEKPIDRDELVEIVLENCEVIVTRKKNLEITRNHKKEIRKLVLLDTKECWFDLDWHENMTPLERLNRYPDIVYLNGETFKWYVIWDPERPDDDTWWADHNKWQKTTIEGDKVTILFGEPSKE